MRYEQTSARELLVRTPSTLRAMLQGLPAAWLDAPEATGGWSPKEVACHMADLERDAWLPRAQSILDHGSDRPLPDIDRERFRERYRAAAIGEVLDDFQAAREANVAALSGLAVGDEALAAVGRHHVLGDVRLSQLLSTWVVHDLTHLAQINRALASQYREEVGPWVEFLSILRRPEDPKTTTPGGSERRSTMTLLFLTLALTVRMAPAHAHESE